MVYKNAPKIPASPTIRLPAPTMISLLAPFFPVALAAVELAVLLAVLTAPGSPVVCDALPPDVDAAVVAADASDETVREMAVVGFGAEE